jgi:hydroxyacylglutathione hydrolase
MSQLQVEVVPVTPFGQNCSLVFDEATREGVVVDPGGDLERIEAAIARHKVVPRAIWLTHGHIDHAGGADELRERLGLEVIGPERQDAPLLSGLEDQARMFGLPGPVRNLVPDRWLDDGEVLSVADHRFDVIHAPGHAPGHVVFFNRAARFLIGGDVLFAGSVGRTDLPYGDHATLLATIRDRILPLGDDVAFLPGHGPGGTIGEERRTNPFLQGL